MEPTTTGLLIALMVASFYFLIIRPNRKRQAEQAKLASSMQPGSRVMLSSGIYGTVKGVGEKQASVELAPGVQVRVLKQAVLQVITPESQFAEDAPVIEEPAAADDEWTIADDDPVHDPIRADLIQDDLIQNDLIQDDLVHDDLVHRDRVEGDGMTIRRDEDRIHDIRADDDVDRGNEGQKG